jgi:hypothetical protein
MKKYVTDHNKHIDLIKNQTEPDMSKNVILKNRAECNLCKDIIESKHRHDFVSCKCGAIILDGGTDYLRRLGDLEQINDLSVVVPREKEIKEKS